MVAYRVELGCVLERTGGEVALEGVFDLRELVVGDERFTLIEPAAFAASVANTGAGFVLSGTVSARVDTECARCLRGFEMAITAGLEGFYVRHGEERTVPEEQDYGYVEGGGVDIGPALESALALEAPFAPLHDPGCPGLCPECGADLNEGACGCDASCDADGPFGALRDMLPEHDGGE